jgi:hypothetical protein
MQIHAIQTGRVQIKASLVVGRGHGLARRLAPLTDRAWSAWLATHAYAIEHRVGALSVVNSLVPQAPGVPSNLSANARVTLTEADRHLIDIDHEAHVWCTYRDGRPANL